MKRDTPEAQLNAFIAKYSPEIAAQAKALLAKMRARLPGAFELVYDNYNALAIGFGPTERASDAILSIALYPRWINLFFLEGAHLPDPHKLLKGSGKQVRSITLKRAEDFDEPLVQELVSTALEFADPTIDGRGEGRLVIKSVSERQRSRRTK